MRSRWLILVGLLLAPLRAAQPAPTTFHVAPGGSDRNPGTRDRPFATPARAREAVRELKRRHGGALKSPVTVQLRGGTFPLAEPLVLTAEDSGTKEHPVTWSAAPGERPVLSGGRRLTGWKPTAVQGKPLWTTSVPEVKAGRWRFHQLWVNGQRRVRARHPNKGFLRIAALPEVKKDTPWNKGQDRFRFAPGDLRAYANLPDVDVVALHLWVGVRLAVAAVDEKERLVTFAKRSSRRLTDGNEPARYYVENALELLDSPGEWYLNRRSGTVHYWPLPGEQPDKVEATAPALPHLLRLEGRPEKGRFVEHLHFRGLTFAHAEWWPQRNDPADAQAAANVPAAVQGDGARHCRFEGCTVARVGGYGIHLARGCSDNRIVGCDLFDLGAGGVRVGETTIRQAAAEQTHGNVVTDNHVRDGGLIFPQAVGVWVGQSHGNRIAHNHIHDLFYTGISVGWTWGYGKTLARDNVVEANRVHHIGRGLLSDMGGVYTLGVQPGTVVRGNVFHDIEAHRYGGWGIYFDEGTTHVVAEGNLVSRTTHGGFHQHFGKENVVRNNVFALGRDAQIQRTRIEDHKSFTFERNIVYWRQGALLAGNWAKLNADFDRNCYWHEGGKEVRFGKLTWGQWRQRGADGHSLLADPLFEDVAKADFRLRPQSPARKLGFVPLELSRVGPRKKEG
jgi:hypothetical protein